MKCVCLLQCFKLRAKAFSGAFGKKNTKHAIAAAIEALRHIEALSKLLPKEVRDFQQEAIRSHIVDSSDNTHNT